MGIKNWTEEEEFFISENINKLTAVEMAQKLGRTPDSIRYKIRTSKPKKDINKNACMIALNVLLGNGLVTEKQAEVIKKRIASA